MKKKMENKFKKYNQKDHKKSNNPQKVLSNPQESIFGAILSLCQMLRCPVFWSTLYLNLKMSYSIPKSQNVLQGGPFYWLHRNLVKSRLVFDTPKRIFHTPHFLKGRNSSFTNVPTLRRNQWYRIFFSDTQRKQRYRILIWT